MRLLIVSHTPHYELDGRYVGWGPTIRELDYLAPLFDEVVHVAPVFADPAPLSALPYTSERIRLRPVQPAGGDNLGEKLDILRVYPQYAALIGEEMSHVDAIHVRCPANISLLTLLILKRRSGPPYRWIKYAGNWRPDGHDPWSYRLQRDWLAKQLPGGVVTVNGNWPDQPPHVFSFHNPCLTDDETDEGRARAVNKQLTSPLELLFVGAINEGKGVGQVLRIVKSLQSQNITTRLSLLGDGPDRMEYENWSRHNRLEGVRFLGWVPRTELAAHYAAAHVILLPSRSEGWPKVLSEAMAYGVVPVAAAVSSIPQILGETGAGFTFPPDDIEGMAGVIAGLVANPGKWKAASQAGVLAAQQFTYRYYQRAVTDLFAKTWGVRLHDPNGSRTMPAALNSLPQQVDQ
jgi:glycosyltransferase involved in cell wall biosynthesis